MKYIIWYFITLAIIYLIASFILWDLTFLDSVPDMGWYQRFIFSFIIGADIIITSLCIKANEIENEE